MNREQRRIMRRSRFILCIMQFIGVQWTRCGCGSSKASVIQRPQAAESHKEGQQPNSGRRKPEAAVLKQRQKRPVRRSVNAQRMAAVYRYDGAGHLVGGRACKICGKRADLNGRAKATRWNGVCNTLHGLLGKSRQEV